MPTIEFGAAPAAQVPFFPFPTEPDLIKPKPDSFRLPGRPVWPVQESFDERNPHGLSMHELEELLLIKVPRTLEDDDFVVEVV